MHAWRAVGILVAAAAMLAPPAAASATVIFGHGVYIGGHDFSYQRFDRRHRGLVYLYDRAPRNAGCRWHADGRGGYVKVCHLRRLK